MQFHRGRLIDHVHLRVADVEASKRFYRAVVEVFGLAIQHEGTDASGDAFFAVDELFVSRGKTSSHVHLAFQARDRETVEKFYRVALEAGGRDNGKPGERPYHPGYFGAFVFDPDGNNIEAVFHGPSVRSADSVIFTPKMPDKP